MRRFPLLALVALAGCLAPGSPAESAEGLDRSAATPTEYTTGIFDGAFQHARLELHAPVVVRWWNVGNETHAVSSEDDRFPASGAIFPLAEFALAFETPGEYAFRCPYHAEMRGVLLVR